MSMFELRPWNSAQTDVSRIDLVWSDDRNGGDLRTDLDPWLTRFGDVPPVALDLTRLATAAFVGDQLLARGIAFARDMDVLVHLREPDAWSDETLAELADLLASLTGDSWRLSVIQETSPNRLTRAPFEPGETAPSARRVALLSGGLDSFAGAVLSSASEGMSYFGHWDQPATKHAQDDVKAWFTRSGRPLDYVQVFHTIRAKRAERTTRSRSALFIALAVALAAARGARVVEVPENGFTSLNPPLGPERGGAFTTRSTHPVTINRFNRLLERLGLDARVENPHAWRTKGELVSAAAAVAPGDIAAGAALTLSCAKLNGNYYKGGDPNGQCGLCVACVTRRGSLIAAGVDDRTEYLFDRLTGGSRDDLLRHRSADREAILMAIEAPIDDVDLMAIGPYPEDFNLDEAVELCRRGFEELARALA